MASIGLGSSLAYGGVPGWGNWVPCTLTTFCRSWVTPTLSQDRTFTRRLARGEQTGREQSEVEASGWEHRRVNSDLGLGLSGEWSGGRLRLGRLREGSRGWGGAGRCPGQSGPKQWESLSSGRGSGPELSVAGQAFYVPTPALLVCKEQLCSYLGQGLSTRLSDSHLLTKDAGKLFPGLSQRAAGS